MRFFLLMFMVLGLSGSEADMHVFLRTVDPDDSSLDVVLDAIDTKGAVIDGLRPERFELVLDKGSRLRARSVSSALGKTESAQLLVLVQATPSMAAVLEPVTLAVQEWGKLLKGHGEIGLWTYEEVVYRRSEMNRALVQNLKLKVESDDVQPQALPALRTATELLIGQRKLLVVITDGSDQEADARAFESVGKALAQKNVVVNVILVNANKSPHMESWRRLSQLTRGTLRIASSSAQLPVTLAQVSAELKGQYRVTFPWKGEAHEFRVVLKQGNKEFLSNPLSVKSGPYQVPLRKNAPP